VDSGVHERMLVRLDLPTRSQRHMHQFDCSTVFFVGGKGKMGGGFVLQNGPCPNGFTVIGAGGKNGPFFKKGGGAFTLSDGAQCVPVNPAPINLLPQIVSTFEFFSNSPTGTTRHPRCFNPSSTNGKASFAVWLCRFMGCIRMIEPGRTRRETSSA
jgi:hypothetical protein